jgi:hypothetical protein
VANLTDDQERQLDSSIKDFDDMMKSTTAAHKELQRVAPGDWRSESGAKKYKQDKSQEEETRKLAAKKDERQALLYGRNPLTKKPYNSTTSLEKRASNKLRSKK